MCACVWCVCMGVCTFPCRHILWRLEVGGILSKLHLRCLFCFYRSDCSQTFAVWARPASERVPESTCLCPQALWLQMCVFMSDFTWLQIHVFERLPTSHDLHFHQHPGLQNLQENGPLSYLQHSRASLAVSSNFYIPSPSHLQWPTKHRVNLLQQ